MKAIGVVYLNASVIPLPYYKKEVDGELIYYYLLDGSVFVRKPLWMTGMQKTVLHPSLKEQK